MNIITLFVLSLVNGAYISKWSGYQSVSPFIRSLSKFTNTIETKTTGLFRMHRYGQDKWCISLQINRR